MVTDVDGNTLLDFAGGIGTLNVGHADSSVGDAVCTQVRRLTHACFGVAPYEPYLTVAEALNRMAPGRALKRTLLLNSGAEAVENAVKIARYHTRRPGVVTFEHGFAGRTLLTMSLTSKVMPYKHGFGPFAPEVYRLPYPYFYRSGFDNEAAFVEAAISGMRDFFRTHVAPDQVACVWMELVLGEGGFVVAPAPYVSALAALCREHGILFIADEIQTGFGRTGRTFASEHYGLEPDLVTMAKSLAGGMVLSAVTGRADVMDSVHPGGLGGTFGGNPVSCAAAVATLQRIETLDLVKRACAVGDRLRARLTAWQRRFACVGDVRGLGAMMAMELVEDRKTKAPARTLTAALVTRSAEHGVLLMPAGTFGNVIRFLMPLVATDDQLDEGLDVIEGQLTALTA
jgi:4-aminobutyrate aminotransferase / (S)-3-amino-2-methylpropionate transaminase / 5-aminovalerate transaminase